MSIQEYGYEYDAVKNDALFLETKGKAAYERLWNGLCLRSGRDALKVIAREYRDTIVLLPALSCDSMILPFEMYHHPICFYRLTEEYAIDDDHLQTLLHACEGNAIFLYMDYFGKMSVSDEILTEMRQVFPRLIFVEDRTHNLIWKKDRVFSPDYTIASLRKWINVPDGGIFWTEHMLRDAAFAEDDTFFSTRLSAQCMRRKFFETGDLSLKTEYRKIFSTVSDIMDSDPMPSRMSEYSYRLAVETDWNAIRKQRSENAKVLTAILSQNPFVKWIQNEPCRSDLYVPFMIPNRDAVQGLLSPLGVFNTIIWPLCDEQKSVCPIAKYTEEHMLAAPCDQRYSVKDMEYIGEKIDSAIRKICQ